MWSMATGRPCESHSGAILGVVEHEEDHHARSRAWSTERWWISTEAGGCGHDRAKSEEELKRLGQRYFFPTALKSTHDFDSH